MNIMYSVIVPIYNAEKYIEECIKSVIHQSYDFFELILIDDGSTDRSYDICNKYSKCDKRIKLIKKNNGGANSARRLGVESARGDYIICIDADDFVDNDYIECFDNILKQKKVDVVCCGYFRNAKRYEPDVLETGFYDKEDIKNKIFPLLIHNKYCKYFPPSLHCKAIRRQLYLLHQKKIDNNIVIGEDFCLVVKILCSARSLSVTYDCKYFYRRNLNSITETEKPINWNNVDCIYKTMICDDEYRISDYKEQLFRKLEHELFNIGVSRFYDNDKQYSVIKNEILCEIEKPLRREIIQRSRFGLCFKGMIIDSVMKNKIIIILYLYCIMKIIVKNIRNKR